MNADIITLQDVDFDYAMHANDSYLPVFRNLSLSVRDREFLTVLGPSGCGKTTLLQLIAGLLSPTRGSLEMSPIHAGVSCKGRFGYVFQSPNLLPWLTAAENVSLPLAIRNSSELKSHFHQSGRVLRDLGLGDFVKSYPWELSLGMQMRVNLARALVMEPTVLLLDEPFSSLDAITRVRLQRDMIRLFESKRMTCILVTHDIDDAVALSDRIVLLSSRPACVIREYPLPGSRPPFLPRPASAMTANLAAAILENMERQSQSEGPLA